MIEQPLRSEIRRVASGSSRFLKNFTEPGPALKIGPSSEAAGERAHPEYGEAIGEGHDLVRLYLRSVAPTIGALDDRPWSRVAAAAGRRWSGYSPRS
jgi:hypothetical protein